MSTARRRFWLGFLGTAALLAVVPAFFEEGGEELAVRRSHDLPRGDAVALHKARRAAGVGDPAALVLAEPARGGHEVVDLFAPRDWTPAPVPVEPAPAPSMPPVVVAPPVATAPTLPFAYMGKLRRADAVQVFLVRGDSLFSVGEGDLIDNDYRVEKIGERSMVFRYLPLDVTQQLAVGSAL